MGNYDWQKIANKYSESELRRIYRDKDKEPDEKVNAVIEEMIKRRLLNSDKDELITPSIEKTIVDTSLIIGRTKSNKKNANRAILGIGLMLIIFLGSIMSSILQNDLLIKAKDGIFITEEMATSNDNREMIVSLVTIIAFFLSAVLFLIWFYNAYENNSKRISKTNFSVGWSIGAWFVPIISWFRPYNIMDEINRNANKILNNRGVTIKSHGKALIAIWWGLFLTTVFLSRVLLKLSLRADTIDNLIWATIGDMIISALGIALSIVTIIMIKKFALKEEALFEGERINS